MTGDWGVVLAVAVAAAVAAIPSFVLALMARRDARNVRGNVERLEISVDGRLSELLKSRSAEADAKGHARGTEEERDRQEGL